jgi:uncharacterized delta-60 repeat protein
MRRPVAAFAVLVASLAGPPAAGAAPGDLDTAFGAQGLVTDGAAQTDYDQPSLLVLPDGRFLVTAPNFGHPSDGYLLSRHNADGSLDTGFGTRGRVLAKRGTFPQLALAPDGAIVVATLDRSGKRFAALVERYRPDGKRDPAFSGDGRLTVRGVGSYDGQPSGVAVLADGRILLLQDRGGAIGVLRLAASGQLDRRFGSAGRVRLRAGGRDDITDPLAFAVDAAGRIVVAGNRYRQGPRGGLLFRLTPAGRRDRSFSGDGRADVPGVELGVMRVQPDRAILVAPTVNAVEGGRENPPPIERRRPTGAVDAAFALAARTLPDCMPFATALALQPDGGIVDAGSSGVARLLGTGAIDVAFGSAGRVAVGDSSCGKGSGPLGGFRPSDVALQPGHGILVTGPSRTRTPRVLVTRLVP